MPDAEAMPPHCSRRRVLRLLAATSAGGLAFLAGTGGRAAAPEGAPLPWRGRALGAEAEIRIHHPEPAAARAALAAVRAEVARLEAVFSLSRRDSALSRLNREGVLAPAPAELCRLLDVCRDLHRETAGTFDPTVQVLWTLFADHFARPDAAPDGPPQEAIAQARRRVGLERLQHTGRTLRFAEPGMALTLNGIAQGFITDRAHRILAERGIGHSLINLGEYRALGLHPDGRAWRIGIADPLAPWRTIARIDLEDGRAIATSAGAGASFDAAMRHHHLFDPITGRSAEGWKSVSLTAPSATLADGLSTALAAAPPARAADILGRYPGAGALLLAADGRLSRIGRAA